MSILPILYCIERHSNTNNRNIATHLIVDISWHVNNSSETKTFSIGILAIVYALNSCIHIIYVQTNSTETKNELHTAFYNNYVMKIQFKVIQIYANELLLELYCSLGFVDFVVETMHTANVDDFQESINN